MKRFERALVWCSVFGLVMMMVPVASALDTEAPFPAGAVEGDEVESYCTATVDCWDGTTRSCTGVSPCSYLPSNCPSSRGWVSCGGARTYCPPCPLLQCDMDGARCWGDYDCRPSGYACDSCVCDYSVHEASRIPEEGGVCFCLLPY
jgi:hypothetical protein